MIEKVAWFDFITSDCKNILIRNRFIQPRFYLTSKETIFPKRYYHLETSQPNNQAVYQEFHHLP